MTARPGQAAGPVGVGVIGTGVISEDYLANLARCPDIRLVAVADLDPTRARDAAGRHGVEAASSPESLVADDRIELVLNLTPPAAHAAVARLALNAGRHVYSEKPLSADPRDGAELLALAARLGLRVGCAPDTVLGSGIQSGLRALRAGAIGAPVAARFAMETPGPVRWHPGPEFLYGVGGGPVLDRGPYYLSALVSALGPIRSVAAHATRARDELTVAQGPRAGTVFAVTAPTHVTVSLGFASGAVASGVFSFDAAAKRADLEITGTEGALRLPDPNRFAGESLILTADGRSMAAPETGTALGRGIGVVDLARAIRSGAAHRASGDLAQHVLEALAAIEESAHEDRVVAVLSRPTLPDPLDDDWDPLTATLTGIRAGDSDRPGPVTPTRSRHEEVHP